MNKPIRVLAIVNQMNPGGLEKRLMDIIRQIDNKRVVIDVFTYQLKKGKLDDDVRKHGGIVYYNPPLTVRNMFWYVSYFENFLKEHLEYRIIHAHQDAWCSVFCKGGYLAEIPVRIAHSRTSISTVSVGNIIKNIIKLPARKYASHYFAVSKLAGTWLFGTQNMNSGKVQVWKNAINCQKFRYDATVREKMRKVLDVQNKKVIMHVGNFSPPKNQLFLLDVILNLIAGEPDYILILVGEEKESGLLQKSREIVIKRRLSDHVRFLGNRDDVHELLQAADVFCFPSLFEGLPGAVLEAQAAGLPCIISSSITDEVKVLNTTKILALEMGAEVWSREIKNSMNIKRCDTFEEMVRAGFDIQELTEKLTEFYETAGGTRDAI